MSFSERLDVKQAENSKCVVDIDARWGTCLNCTADNLQLYACQCVKLHF